MRFHDLKGRNVVGVAEAHELGTVNNLVLDLQTQSILGLLVKTGGLLSRDQAVPLGDVNAIGADAVTVEDASKLNGQSKFADLKGKPTMDVVLGANVMSEDGAKLGSVSDVELDVGAGRITEYILSEGLVDRLRGDEHYIPSSSVKSVGEKLIVVAAERSEAG